MLTAPLGSRSAWTLTEQAACTRCNILKLRYLQSTLGSMYQSCIQGGSREHERLDQIFKTSSANAIIYSLRSSTIQHAKLWILFPFIEKSNDTRKTEKNVLVIIHKLISTNENSKSLTESLLWILKTECLTITN